MEANFPTHPLIGLLLRLLYQHYSEDTHAALREAGFGARDIWDIAAVAGFFNMSNRVASATDMRPNPDYHGQAR